MGKINLHTPEPLNTQHDLTKFNCGEVLLDEWLRQRALKNEVLGASRTFVVCSEGYVIGYYALAAGSIAHTEVVSKLKRNMPDPIPAIILARLAVDKSCQGQGLGYSLLQDMVLRCQAAAGYIGAKVILVHALSDKAKAFYEYFGFRASPIDDRVLMLALSELV
ncbi:GNAT family N-acetyltransferase [uncultured Thiothrix sp.]|uniref:GNAT family N-acetyltransferase n=1 Tax=uncultured Thiothrix sp. TaxID=223185 RepID=UPI00260745A3|nr:GNAT family N-acetyltransferase [uncultured Thiothrix sp.]